MTVTEPLTTTGDRPLLNALAEHWWLFLLRGIAAVIFGILAIALPGITILTLTLLWGAYAIVDGACSLWAAIMGNAVADRGPRWWLAVVGILGLVAGVIALVFPGPTAAILLIAIAAWAIAIGVMQIIGAIRLRKEIDHEWLLGLSGLASIAFGLLFFMQPMAGALAVVWLISFFALFFGIDLIFFAFRLRKHHDQAA